jgi:hypothetical protein
MNGPGGLQSQPELFETAGSGAVCILNLDSDFSNVNNINFYQECGGATGSSGLCEVNAQTTQQLNEFINKLNPNTNFDEPGSCSSTVITIQDTTGQQVYSGPDSWKNYINSSSYQGKFSSSTVNVPPSTISTISPNIIAIILLGISIIIIFGIIIVVKAQDNNEKNKDSIAKQVFANEGLVAKKSGT